MRRNGGQMTIQECYEQMGLNAESVLERLGSETILKKFVVKFLDDPSFQSLKEGLEEKDGEKAFRAAHTLKGICLNLGFDNLFKVSSDITEKLRGGSPEGCEALFEAVEKEYEKTVNAIRSMAAEE